MICALQFQNRSETEAIEYFPSFSDVVPAFLLFSEVKSNQKYGNGRKEREVSCRNTLF
jgi:hypothetical protein